MSVKLLLFAYKASYLVNVSTSCNLEEHIIYLPLLYSHENKHTLNYDNAFLIHGLKEVLSKMISCFLVLLPLTYIICSVKVAKKPSNKIQNQVIYMYIHND